ncbi:MAG: hypothetical protein ACTSRE_16530 [Promethearchaeota archaeon]
MIDNQNQAIILDLMKNNPGKYFSLSEMEDYMKQKGITGKRPGSRAKSSLSSKKYIDLTFSDGATRYKINNKGIKALESYCYRVFRTFLLRGGGKDYSMEDLRRAFHFDVDEEWLAKFIKIYSNELGIIRPVYSDNEEVKFVITREGRKERRRNTTANVLRRIDRDFKKKERSKSFQVDEVGLGGQVTRSYTTSQKSLNWTIIGICIFTIVAILVVIFVL